MQWHQSYKSFGYEIIDLRLGGVVTRLKTTKKVLQALLNGECEYIEQLEVTRLPYTRGCTEPITLSQYAYNVSPNRLSW